tara:strand:+ start:1333 stop:1503 length:171 start_codon:yes stop_codon:yes gene_type:complete
MPCQSEEQKAAIRKEYRDNNKQKIALQKKEYYQKNKEIFKARSKQQYINKVVRMSI